MEKPIPIIALLGFLMIHLISSSSEESSTCLALYKEGGAPAVFQSPKCPAWSLSDKQDWLRTANCQSAMLRGRRSHQEDRTVCALDLRIPFPSTTGFRETNVGMIAVFDGHNGDEASEMASKLLLEYFLLHVYFLLDGMYSVALKKSNGRLSYKGDQEDILQVLNQHKERNQRNLDFERSNLVVPLIFDGSIYLEILKESLLRTIRDIDVTFSKEAYKKSLESGSTATIVLIANGQILVANVGDSKAFLCSKGSCSPGAFSRYNGRQRRKDAIFLAKEYKNLIKMPEFDGSTYFCVNDLTRDHHPDREDEKARVEAAGGYVVEWGGVARVNGELAISRAIGDVPYKSYGVISLPEVTDWQPLPRNGSYLIVASDGVFEKMSTQDICDLLWDVNTQNMKSSGHLLSESLSLADYIVNTAFERGSMDNIATVLVPLGIFKSKLMERCGLQGSVDSGTCEPQGVSPSKSADDVIGSRTSLVPMEYFNQFTAKLRKLMVAGAHKKIDCFYLSENLNENAYYIFKAQKADKKDEVSTIPQASPVAFGQCYYSGAAADLYSDQLCLLRNKIDGEKGQSINPEGFSVFLGLLESIPFNDTASNSSGSFGYGTPDFRYSLKRRFGRGSYGEVWLAFQLNCSEDDDPLNGLKKNNSSVNSFCLDPHECNMSTKSNMSSHHGFPNPSNDDMFILKRIMVEKGAAAYLSGLREKYFGELFLNASLSLGGTVSPGSSSKEAHRSLLQETSGMFTRKRTINFDHEQGLMHIARYVESFESQSKEIWLVFRNEGLSLSKLIYTADETKTVTSEERDERIRNVQVLRPSTWWHWLKTTETGKIQMRNLIWQLLMALKSCHDRNITHRDIKPENMVICFEEKETGRCLRGIPSGEKQYHIKMRIIDFGSAIDQFAMKHLYGSNGPSRFEQTLEYAPPEALLNASWFRGLTSVTSKYDMWSVGVVMLELILGSPHAFEISARTQVLLDQHLKGWNEGMKELAYKLRSLMEMCILAPGSSARHHQKDGMKDHTGAWPASWKCSEESFSNRVKNRDPLKLGFPNIWALRLVRQLLLWYPEDRLSVDDALRHPYFQQEH